MIIAIDGIDGVGKRTQSELLHKYFTDKNIKAKLISFPQYTSFYGKMVAEYLNGKYGGLDEIEPKLVSVLYAADRKLYFDENDLAEYDVIIFDRYVPSNIGHQVAKVKESEQQDFLEWIEDMEYNVNKIPRPDIMLILDADISTSVKQVSEKAKRDYTDSTHDLHESNTDYLSKVRNIFLKLESEENTTVIKCTNDDSMLSIQEISKKILEVVNKYNS